MKLSLKLTAAVCLLFVVVTCHAQVLEQKVFTDTNDVRLRSLYGKWYVIRSGVKSKNLKFTKTVIDTADVTVEFRKNGTYTLYNKSNKLKPSTDGRWFLQKNKLYYEDSRVYEGDANVNTIISISDTLLEYKYWGRSNIYQAALCEDVLIYKMTEVAPQYGTTTDDLYNYFSKNLKLSDSTWKVNQVILIDFAINCNGQVCNVKPFSEKNTEFEKAIVTLLRKMPKWSPAMMGGKAVNYTFTYTFGLKDGVLVMWK